MAVHSHEQATVMDILNRFNGVEPPTRSLRNILFEYTGCDIAEGEVVVPDKLAKLDPVIREQLLSVIFESDMKTMELDLQKVTANSHGSDLNLDFRRLLLVPGIVSDEVVSHVIENPIQFSRFLAFFWKQDRIFPHGAAYMSKVNLLVPRDYPENWKSFRTLKKYVRREVIYRLFVLPYRLAYPDWNLRGVLELVRDNMGVGEFIGYIDNIVQNRIYYTKKKELL